MEIMSKKKNNLVLLLTSILIITAGIVLAQDLERSRPHENDPDRFRGEMPGMQRQRDGIAGGEFRPVLMLMSRLDLSEDQKAQVEMFVSDARDEIESIIASSDISRESSREEFLRLFAQSSITVEDLENVIGQNEDFRNQIRNVILEAIVDIHDVLTEEQLERIAAFGAFEPIDTN